MSTHLTTHYSFFREQAGGELRAEVRLGSPRFSDCRGVGICAIYLDSAGPLARACPCTVPASLSVEPVTGRLLLSFDRYALTDRVVDRHFASGYLKVQDAYRLPPPVAAALGIRGDTPHIAPGRYPVLEGDYYLHVSCRLTEVQTANLRRLRDDARAA